MAIAVQRPAAGTPDQAKLVDTWKRRITQARDYRRQFEPTWLSNLAFANGQHWLVWDDKQAKMRHLAEVDPKYEDRDLYAADKINEHVQAQLGELESGDDRPELLLAQQGDTAEEIQQFLNDCAAHGWEYEWGADSALTQVRRLCLKLGTAAIRVRFDPAKGPLQTHVPIHPLTGQPILDGPSLDHLEQTGQLPDGNLPAFKPINEGRTCWDVLSAFNLLTPPGANHEDKFPWEVVMSPVLIDDAVDEYGDAAQDLVEDSDIASMIGLSTSQITRTGGSRGDRGRLRDHVWLFRCYQRPSRQQPQGQVVHIASNQMQLMRVEETLPVQTVEGEWRSGLHYFHWWRKDDCFYSRAMIEPLKDPQRMINRREVQNVEIIDRGMPKVFTREGTLIQDPTGAPLENIELKDDKTPPEFHAGIGPGSWMYDDLAHHADNMAHASTLSQLRLGENPTNVNTYAQLALLNENEGAKRDVIFKEHQSAIGGALVDSMYFARRYWPERKQILVAGDEGSITAKTYEKSKVPDMYVVRRGTGSARPRSQGAELTKVDAIWNAAAAAGVVTANPQKWVEWYTKSLDAGQALDLPGEEAGSQVEFAHFENFLLEQGEQPPVAPHDLAPVHAPIHYELLDQARAADDQQLIARTMQHLEAHTQEAALTRKAWRFFDPNDTNDLASDVALDEDQALRENEMLVQGIPLNPESFQQAYAALQRGTNPETGQPVNPQTDDLHQILERAALAPTFVENFQMHLDRHGKVIKSAAFASYPPDVRRRFQTHFDLTRDMWLSLPTMPDKIAAPKVTLSLRESVGPTTIAQTLRRAGVPEADPQTLAAEPPMENQVVDDVGEPDVDTGAAGQNGPSAQPQPPPDQGAAQ